MLLAKIASCDNHTTTAPSLELASPGLELVVAEPRTENRPRSPFNTKKKYILREGSALPPLPYCPHASHLAKRWCLVCPRHCCTASPAALLLAAAFTNSSAFSLPETPWCASTHRTATSLSRLRIRVQTSETATAKRCTGPGAYPLILSMAAVESEKTVQWWPLPWRWSMVLRAL